MKRNIIISLALALIIGGVVYAFTNKDKNPPIADNEIENNIDKEDDIKDDTNNEIEDDTNDKAEEEIIDNEEIDQFEPQIVVGEKLPNFTLKNLQGKDVSLTDYEGKIVLVNFWATWCGFCKEQMPILQRLSEENDDLAVLGVNVEEEKSEVEKYMSQGGYNFEVVLDEKGEVAMDYLVSGFPASYFTNTEGVFLGRVPGMLTYEQMNEILDDIRENQ